MKATFENQSGYEVMPITVTKVSNLNFLPHWHVDVEFIFVLEGTIQLGINTDRRLLHAGDIAICCSNSIHYFISESINSVLLIKFLPEYIEGYGTWQKNHNFLYPFIERKSVKGKEGIGKEVYDEITALFFSLHKEMEQKKDFYKMIIKGKLLELCAKLQRHLPKQECEYKNEQSISSIKIVQDSLKYIEENYMNNISLEKIAKIMKVSPYYFSRIFNKVIGMNLKTYQNLIRINKAENMIVCDQLPITNIAYECGFNSIRTFNRCFRLVKGYTPSDLRKTGY
jgi:AraC-like DNA-binding protein/mannose-6-phosphate isomerase-like protein (cupin superfamily)